jgi:hypothetical protein
MKARSFFQSMANGTNGRPGARAMSRAVVEVGGGRVTVRDRSMAELNVLGKTCQVKPAIPTNVRVSFFKIYKGKRVHE